MLLKIPIPNTEEKHMKYHRGILQQLDAAQLDEDPIGASRLVNLAMTIDEIKPEDAQPIYDKIEETLDWMERCSENNDNLPERVTETISAARDWLTIKKASDENTGDQVPESGDQMASTAKKETGCGCGEG